MTYIQFSIRIRWQEDACQVLLLGDEEPRSGLLFLGWDLVNALQDVGGIRLGRERCPGSV